MERIRIKAGKFDFVARFESERAPKTCAKFRTHAAVQGAHHPCALERRRLLDSARRPRPRAAYENHTSYPAPGEIILYPGGISETEILVAYGGVHFASKVGQLAGNHFLTIVEGREQCARSARPCSGTARRILCSKRCDVQNTLIVSRRTTFAYVAVCDYITRMN